MKTAMCCYNSFVSNDNSCLYLLGEFVIKINTEVDSKEIFKTQRIENICHGSESLDNNYLTVINTLGDAYVFNSKDGNLLFEYNADFECNGAFMDHKNNLIVNRLDGIIDIYNYFSRNTYKIITGEKCSKLIETKKPYEFLLFSNKNNYLHIYVINTVDKTKKLVFDYKNITIETNTLYRKDENYYFVGSDFELDDSVWNFNYSNCSIEKVVNVPKEVYDTSCANCLSVGENNSLIAIGFRVLLLYDLKKNKFIKSYDKQYISCCSFFDNDKKIFIGTWEGGYSVEI